MSERLQGMVFFSDDVRDETGGKSSFMGVMGDEVEVYGSKAVRNTAVVLMFWAPPGEHKVSGGIKVTNAQETFKQPPGLNTMVPDQGPLGNSMVQMIARLQTIRLTEEPVLIEARFMVDDQEFSANLRMTYKGDAPSNFIDA